MRAHQLRCFRLLILSVLIFIFCTPALASRPGTLDPGFGTGGIALAQVPNFNPDGPRDIITQPDGKIIVVGAAFSFPNGVVSLARWNADGTLDSGFGNGGIVTTDILPQSDYTNSIALQADGKIVIAGETMRVIPGEKGWDFEIFVVRYNSDGSLDTTFGSGGLVLTPFGSNSVIDDIAIQPDGKIVIGGNSGGGFLALRYNSDGSLDTTFDGDGIASNSPTFAGSIFSMALQPDGKIILSGSTHNNAVITRYNSNGSTDTGFGTGGFISIPIGISVTMYGTALQPDGKILVAGAGRVNFPNRTEATLLRLNTNGTPDGTFSGDGLAVTNIPDGPGMTAHIEDRAMDVVPLSSGKIVVIGHSVQNPQSFFAIMRYQADGSLDNGFDRDGIATLITPSGNCMRLLSDGKILVGGGAVINGTFYDLAVSRFLMKTNPLSDFDGDGKTDVAVFRPSNGVWYVNSSLNDSLSISQFGMAGDLITPADYDGDGRTDIAVWRASNGVWFWLNSSNGTLGGNQFGLSDDKPVPGDFDGDSKADIAIFRPSTGSWWIMHSNDGSITVQHFGSAGDKPVLGDFDGDAKTDLAVFRPSGGIWYRLNSSDGAFIIRNFGLSEDKAVPGDYDGDDKTDIAVFRPSTGAWYWINSSTEVVSASAFGISEDRASPGDYDGDGKADRAVFRPSQGFWYIMHSAAGFGGETFGVSGDIPAPNSFIR